MKAKISSFGIRNLGLVIVGIVLLAVGLVASFYQETQFFNPGPAPGGFLASQIVYPYRNIGVILLAFGIVFIVTGFLLWEYSKAQQSYL